MRSKRTTRFVDGIEFRVLVIMLAPAFVLFILLTSYHLYSRTQDIEAELDAHGNLITSLISSASESAIVSGNLDYLHVLLDGQVKKSQVHSITVTDSAGHVIITASSNMALRSPYRRYEAPVMLLRTPNDAFALIDTPVSSQATESKLLGHVVVIMSTDTVKKKQVAVVLYGLLLSLIAMMLAGVIGQRIGGALVVRIVSIIDGVHRIRRGIYTQPISGLNGDSELDRLAKDINATAHHLHELLTHVAEEKERAELLVALRTAELGNAHDNVRRLVQRTNRLVEAERKKIARDIHDHLNALIVAIRLDAQGIDRIIDRSTCNDPLLPEVKQRIDRMLLVINDVYATGRRIVHHLRPEVIDAMGLKGALEDLVNGLNKLHTECHFTVIFDYEFGFDDEIDMAIYRITQEALSNTIKHAQATHVCVKLQYIEGDRDLVRIIIEDDGIGFDQELQRNGIGLISMQERAHGVGGVISISSSPAVGTTIRVDIPIRPQ